MSTSIGRVFVVYNASFSGPFHGGGFKINYKLISVTTEAALRVYPIGLLLAEIKKEVDVQVGIAYDLVRQDYSLATPPEAS